MQWFRPALATRRQYRKRFSMRLRDWLAYHQRDIVFTQCNWMGVRTLKNPMDMWIYQELIASLKPQIILEIGSNEGGSTLYFAHLLDLIGAGTVISVDIDRTNYHVSHPRIVEITGDSSAPEIIAAVHEQCVGQSVLVMHDGDHHAAQVRRDLEAYADLVSVGGYIVVEDGIVDVSRLGGPWIRRGDGPLVATEQFLRAHPEFVVDPACERYLLTYNPKGFLKRVQ